MLAPRAAWRTTTPPAQEPVALSDVKAALGIASGDTSRDAELTLLITSSRQLAEAYTGRALITQTITLQLDEFPGLRATEAWWDGTRQGSIRHLARQTNAPLALPRPPLQTIVSVTWYDEAGTGVIMQSSEYLVDALTEPARLIPTDAWPAEARGRVAAHILYTAGYGSNASDVPAAIRQALIAHIRDVWERPNAAISSETIDNASTTYGAAAASVLTREALTGGLRGDAANMLLPYRVTETGLVPL